MVSSSSLFLPVQVMLESPLTNLAVGFGLSGLLQDILVRPVAMVVPQSLVYVTMFHTLHDKTNGVQGQHMRMFAIVFVAVFIYQVRSDAFPPNAF